jgi:hypothetical protein
MATMQNAIRAGAVVLGAALPQVGCLALDVAFDIRDTHHGIVGSGILVTEARPVGDIRSIVVSGTARVVVYLSDEPWLEVTAESNLLPHLWTETRGRRLEVGQQPGVNLAPTHEVLVRVGVRDLHEVSVSGAAEVDIPYVVTEGLSVVISGAGVVDATGAVEWQHVAISGAGFYDGADLRSREAMVEVSGAGAALVWVADRLEAWVSGDGLVEYYGRPYVRSHVSGSGLVRPAR